MRRGVKAAPALVLFSVLAVACWVFFLSGAGTGMSVWSMSTLQFPPPANPVPMAGAATSYSALLMTSMWWSMMLAMMIPGTLRHFPGAGGTDAIMTAVQLWFGLGYAAVWMVFSIAATCLQAILVGSGLIDSMTMWSTSDRFSAILLGVAGIYQFTGIKTRTLDNCRRSAGRSPGRLTGIRYGINCLVSSCALMLLLFVGGVMNVYWVILLTIVVAIEKAMADPTPFRRAVGLACLAAAAAALAH